ncbi:MAG: CCA tRNA nucleotidyltransferase [Methanolobus sp.]|uniref:CCA tRNA nucleotidyltransferase n=1 Tax=Methanolobus sp. TaxID=1874737 RepID=UPI00272FD109|nr:CCA tRNA nucleotidyltransferase [Methanolobus sp.]MDP2215710.1 CCA tRNA nucleotidyltransferase [Methanolobus sp.]
MDTIMNVEIEVLSRVKPSPGERKRLLLVVEELLHKVDSTAITLGIQGIRAKLVGSAARGTWTSGTHDLDIFIPFPVHTTRDELEKHGLMIAREIAKDADRFEERYAEHPYLNMKYKGFDVDVVPCFAVDCASNIKSAVDRTPFHNKFVKKHIRGIEDEVLKLKQFMKGTGVYGSELRTQGFSGYLTELLVIHYGSFREVLSNACNWKPGIVIDLQEHGSVEHNEPLVVVDPTDPKRNVAAALSVEKFATFIDMCCSYLEEPTPEFFFPVPEKPLTDQEMLEMISERKSSFIAIIFRKPDIVDDVIYPQLDKMESSVRALFEQHAFIVLNSGRWAGKEAIVMVELSSARLPNVKKHRGPPVWERKHAQSFISKYKGSEDAFAFYIEDGNYVADIRRKYPAAKHLLDERLATCSMGKQLTQAVKEGYMVLENEDICNIKDEDFRRFLRKWKRV